MLRTQGKVNPRKKSKELFSTKMDYASNVADLKQIIRELEARIQYLESRSK